MVVVAATNQGNMMIVGRQLSFSLVIERPQDARSQKCEAEFSFYSTAILRPESRLRLASITEDIYQNPAQQTISNCGDHSMVDANTASPSSYLAF